MFDVIAGGRHAIPHRDTVPLLISTAVHAILIGAVAAVPLLYYRAELPDVPDMLAFVTAAPAPAPPPPPPPPPPPAAKAATRPTPKPVATNSVRRAPVEPPKAIVAESENAGVEAEGEEGIPGGVPGGVPGGIPGGVIGGIVPTGIVLPPPPPAPPVARAPVRVGGAITTPALRSRVEPVYPPLALRAHVEGVVILEAVVDRDGRVESVTVLRSIPLLDAAAIAAVRQWRYSPLLLNGTPERFVLTVTVGFSLTA